MKIVATIDLPSVSVSDLTNQQLAELIRYNITGPLAFNLGECLNNGLGDGDVIVTVDVQP